MSECSICFENITNKNKIILICGHIYHKKCIKTWYNFKKNYSCPICRNISNKNDNNKQKNILCKCCHHFFNTRNNDNNNQIINEIIERW